MIRNKIFKSLMWRWANIRGTIRQQTYRLYEMMASPMPEASDDEVDVIIPVIDKDLATLPLSLECILRNCNNQIKNLFSWSC